MKFIAIIPARYASTRFPGKPLADIQGKPMIQHVYVRTSQVFEHCCVATDDTRIAEAVDRFGGCAVMTSPDHRSGTDRCAEALDKYSKTTGTAFDAVINVQGDEPFISTEHLTSLRDALDVPGAEIATLAYPMKPGDDIFNPNPLLQPQRHPLYPRCGTVRMVVAPHVSQTYRHLRLPERHPARDNPTASRYA